MRVLLWLGESNQSLFTNNINTNIHTRDTIDTKDINIINTTHTDNNHRYNINDTNIPITDKRDERNTVHLIKE